jgi:hypothetical protein
MKTSELRNLIREEIKRALREAAGDVYDYSKPQIDANVVKNAMKELKKLSPKLLKATRNDGTFTKFNLPDGPEVRVSVEVVVGEPNEEAGTIKTPKFSPQGAVLVSDEKIDVRLHPLTVSQRYGSELYHMYVTIFKP